MTDIITATHPTLTRQLPVARHYVKLDGLNKRRASCWICRRTLLAGQGQKYNTDVDLPPYTPDFYLCEYCADTIEHAIAKLTVCTCSPVDVEACTACKAKVRARLGDEIPFGEQV